MLGVCQGFSVMQLATLQASVWIDKSCFAINLIQLWVRVCEIEREWAWGVVTLLKRFGAMLRQVNSSARDFKWTGKK